jgi:hypothetical protein
MGFSTPLAGGTQTVATPEFDVDLSTLTVSFWARRGDALSSTIRVGVMSDVAVPSTFTLLHTVAGTTSNWTYYEFLLGDAPYGSRFIAFSVSGHMYTYNFDDLIVSLPCSVPTAVAVSNIGQTSTDITWTAHNSETSWNVVVSPVPVTDLSTAIPAVTSNNPYTASSLTPNTIYYVYVQANCGAGETSAWTPAATFRTLCADAVTSLPWTENFDAYTSGSVPNCWTQVQAYYGYPRVATTNHSTPNSLQFYGIQTQVIATPQFTAEANSTEVSFWLNRNSYDSGAFEIGVMSDVSNPSTFVPIRDITPSAIGNWLYFEIPLNNALAGNHYIAFRQVVNGLANSGYYYLDDVNVHVLPACLRPTSVVVSNLGQISANITWTAGGSETSWNVFVSTVPVTDFSAVVPTATVSSTTYTAAGLTQNTQYYVYIQASCGANGTSSWTNEVAFKTLCDAIALPWSDNFDTYASAAIPGCWTQVQAYISGTNKYPRVVASINHSAANSVHFYGNVTQILATPEFIAEANTAEVSFWLRKSSDDAGTFEVGVMSDVTTPSTFVTALDVTPATSGTAWLHFDVPLNRAQSGNHFIAFRQLANANGYYYLDDVDVHVLPGCILPSSVRVSNVGQATANIAWTAGNAETAWNVVVSNTAITDFTSVVPTAAVTAASYNAAGLNPSTQYYVYVQADCSGGSTSNWTSAVTFKTLCNTTITVFPWKDNFDSYANTSVPACWTHVRTYEGYPRVANSGSHSASNTLEFKASAAQPQIIATPIFAAEVNTLEVSFWLSTFYITAGTPGTIEVGAMSDVSDPNTFVLIGTATPTVANKWSYFEVPLNTAPVGSHFIAFRQTASTGTNRLDDVDVRLWANCPKPTGITASNITASTADITWTAGSSETEWNIIVSQTPITDLDDIDPALINSVSTTPFYLATDLALGSRYYVYVQADCGADRIGRWAEMIFRMPCDVIRTTSWTENFDTYELGDIPACWTRILDFDGYPQVIATPCVLPERTTTFTTMSAPNGLIFRGTYLDGGAYGEQMIATPAFALEDPNTSMMISFWIYTNARSDAYENVLQVGVMSDVSDVNTFTLIRGVDLAVESGAWLHYDIESTRMPGTYYVAFKRTSIHQYQHYVLDDLSVTMNPVSFTPPGVITDGVSDITSTGATLHKTVTPHTYQIISEGFRYRTGTDPWRNITTTAIAEPLSGLDPSTTYQFFAYAMPSAGGQVTGDTLSFTTLEAPVILPTVATEAANNVTQTTATLNKTVTAGSGTGTIVTQGFGYRVAVSGTWTTVVSTPNSNALTGLTANTEYEFRAYAITASSTYYGSILTFTTDVIVGYDTANANDFIIYPNPANSLATVKVEGLRTSAKVTVTDISGKLIETLTIKSGDDRAEFDVANYADGTYLVRVIADGINRVEKLIVKK